MVEIINCDQCRGCCCHDAYFDAWDFPKILYEYLCKLGGILIDVPRNGSLYILVNGNCPQLDKNNKCVAHDDGDKRMSECKSLQPGSDLCLKFRKRDGLV